MTYALLTGKGLIGLSFHTGARERSEIQTLLYGTSSCHQWQQLDEFHVVFVLADKACALDYGALESVIMYLAEYNLESHLRQYLIQLQSQIQVKPKPEPEVAACRPKQSTTVHVHVPEPEPEPEAVTPRWRARIRTKTHGGYVHESSEDITDLDELERLVDRNPYYRDDIKHIKIKLEPKL
jgi:hypothetical protein